MSPIRLVFAIRFPNRQTLRGALTLAKCSPDDDERVAKLLADKPIVETVGAEVPVRPAKRVA